MALPILHYVGETWTITSKDSSKVQAEEIKSLWTVKGRTRADELRNENIKTELGISPISGIDS